MSAFGCYFVQIAVLWGRAGCPLSGVERCPLLGGSKCTISMGRAIGGMEFVHCTEVVHLSESLLLEVSLYTYRSSLRILKYNKFCVICIPQSDQVVSDASKLLDFWRDAGIMVSG